MALNKNSYRVLIVGANDKTFALLSQLLQSGSYEMPLRSGTAGEARRMLLETSAESVTAIAVASGYDDIAYFSKCFKDVFSVSPSVYRRQNAHARSK